MEAHQLRAARALLNLGMTELAEFAGVSKNTILNLEGGGRSHAATVEKLKDALVAQGIVFIGEVAPFYKSTVALRYDMALPSVRADQKSSGEEPAKSGLDALAWDEEEVREAAERADAMREYMRVNAQEWEQLSLPGRTTLEQAIGRLSCC